MGAGVPAKTMKCPYCHEDVARLIADSCPHCNRRIAQFASPTGFRSVDDPVEIQKKQLYWIRFVGVVVAIVFFSWVIAQCQHSG